MILYHIHVARVSSAPGMVVITSFNATSDMSLMLQWEEPPLVDHNGIIEGYRIILEAVEGEGEAPEAKNVNRSTRSYSFTGMYTCGLSRCTIFVI